VLVGREVGQRVRAGQHRLQVVGQFRGRVEFGGHVSGGVEVADDLWVAVEVVVVVVADDAAGLDVVVDGQGVCQQVVPTALALDDSVEAGRLLDVDEFLADAAVGVAYRLALGPVDEVALLWPFRSASSSFAQSGSGNNPGVVATSWLIPRVGNDAV